MSTNFVFVLDADRRPLSPCHPARARELLRRGKASVLRRFPFTIILKRTVTDPVTEGCQVKLDPGSKTTGIAIVQGDRVIWGAEVTHRGAMIKKTLADRSARRRNRRSRLRYRKPSYRTKAQVNNAKRTYERKREQGWLAPSLRHRVDTTMTWVNRLIRFAPVGELTQELVRFDLQKMENPEVEGVQYQQGELVGFEVKEYLLVKWGRKCAYCGAENTPLEVEHIRPRSKGGSDRVSNLTLACTKCNRKKGNKPVEVFLAKKPEVLKRVLAKAKAPLRDAAAVNSTRWALHGALVDTGLPVTVGTGGQTKFNRKQLEWSKAHWLDAAAVGDIVELKLATDAPLTVICKGQGGRRKGVFDKYGQPRKNKKGEPQIRPLKPIHGYRSGDIAKCGDVQGRISPRTSGLFEIRPPGGKPFSRPMRFFTPIHRNDGFEYGT